MVDKIISGSVVERRKVRIVRRPDRRRCRTKGSSCEKKQAGNREYAKLRLARTLNCNFAAGDLWLTLTFDEAGLAQAGGCLAGAKILARNFVARLCYRLKKQGIEAKWILAPSEVDGKTGEVVRPHMHLVITARGFLLQDGTLRVGEERVDDIWGRGWIDVKPLWRQKDFYRLAAYIVNQSNGVPDEKKWTASRNMLKPIVRRTIVCSGSRLIVPAGAEELPGTRYDPERGQNFVRYIPDAKNKLGGHKELALAGRGVDEYGI